MMDASEIIKKKLGKRKLKVYVYRHVPSDCPSCGRVLTPATVKSKKGKQVPLGLSICDICKCTIVSVAFYIKNEEMLESMNPAHTKQLVAARNDRSNRKGYAKVRADSENRERVKRLNGERTREERKTMEEAESERLRALKPSIYKRVVNEWKRFDSFDISAFSDSWLNINIDDLILDTLFVAFLIVDSYGNHSCYFISTIFRDHKKFAYRSSIINISSDKAELLLEAVKTGQDNVTIHNKDFKVLSVVILKQQTFAKNMERIDLKWLFPQSSNASPYSSDDNDSKRVYVYFKLTNRCVKNKHIIETATAKTINAKNGNSVEVNVFHCKNCNRYFINYEALHEYISMGIYPAFSYMLVRDLNGELSEASELMLYGYTVKEGELSRIERQTLLAWIIDSGLMSKADIIKNLQFKVRYNGSKAGNERAKAKWQEDIQFVSRYVRDNSKSINARYVRY